MRKIFRTLTKIYLKIALLSGVFFFCLIAFFYGKNIPYSEQSSIYEGLRTTSGIVFGIMGAWIAIIHPGSLGDFFGDRKTASKQMLRLLSTMLIAVFVLSAVLLIGFIVPALKQVYLIEVYKPVFRGLSYSIVCFLTMLQVWSLFLVLLPNYIVKEKLKKEEGEEEVKKYLTGKK